MVVGRGCGSVQPCNSNCQAAAILRPIQARSVSDGICARPIQARTASKGNTAADFAENKDARKELGFNGGIKPCSDAVVCSRTFS